MSRSCPKCQATIPPLAAGCQCGFVFHESRDLRSVPDDPQCGVCDTPIALMVERCPSCGAVGYPALRPRQGKKCKRVGDEELLAKKPG